MGYISNNQPATADDINIFMNAIQFGLPGGFIDFYKKSNGATIQIDTNFLIIWPITELLKLNVAYQVEKFAPNFFFFGSDGGDIAYAIEKSSGNIYEMPFIGMDNDEGSFKCQKLNELF